MSQKKRILLNFSGNIDIYIKMLKFEKIKKINELKKELEVELNREDKNLMLIKTLNNKIIMLGLTLTTKDFVK